MTKHAVPRLRALPSILLLLALPLSNAFAEAPVVKVGVFQAAPLVFLEGDKPAGLFIDLVEYFSRELGWKVQYRRGTWSELLEELKSGSIDLLPAVGYTAERTKVYDFSELPVYIDSGVVFTARKNVIHTIFDLEGKKIAAVKGSTFTSAFADFIASFGIKCDIVPTDDNIEVMKLIARGDVFAGVCIYSLGNELAKTYPVAITPISFSPIALEFAVAKGRDAGLLAGINKSMSLMADNPTSVYSKSFEKWTVARQGARIPVWLWLSLALILSVGLLFGIVSLILRTEVRAKTAYLRKEIAQHEEAEARLTKALKDNETLLRELYHRTKNTLQLIRSFVTLEALELAPSASIDRLVQKTSDRIDVIALVHQMLYASRDLSRISVKEYIGEMAPLILKSNEVTEGRISLELSVEDREILLDTAIPIGLILNELITNSIKHAFPGNAGGRILIELQKEGEERIILRYRDDGIGVPAGFDFRERKTLGVQLLFRIVETQLKGEIEIETGEGIAYSIRIPTNLYEARI
jgi:two-component sensor histidine kinase/ABC-type amino acid transport substrate-binding protein